VAGSDVVAVEVGTEVEGQAAKAMAEEEAMAEWVAEKAAAAKVGLATAEVKDWAAKAAVGVEGQVAQDSGEDLAAGWAPVAAQVATGAVDEDECRRCRSHIAWTHCVDKQQQSVSLQPCLVLPGLPLR
jgi:hypothetical protein